MRLLYDEAISAVRMLIAMPPIVAMRPKRTYHSSDWPGLKYGSTRWVVTTVLNALTFAATPAMNDAIRPVSAIPSIPLGRYWFINSGTELLYWSASVVPSFGTTTSAIMPGRIMMNGRKSFGIAPISGVRCAADMSFADSARWTSAKLVVQ